MTTWVVVAHRAGARVYARDDDGAVYRVEEIEHPQGRLRDRDIDTDRAGATSQSSRTGRNALRGEESAHHRASANFARDLGRRLARARHDRRYDALLLVAEPGFLGTLREALDRPTTALVAASITKDLGGLPEHEVVEQLDVLLSA